MEDRAQYQVGDDDRYAGPNRRRESWHLKREVNLAHLFTTVAAVVCCAIFLANQDKRLAMVEVAIAQQNKIDSAQDRERLESKAEFKADLKEIKDDIKQIVRRLPNLKGNDR